MRQHGRSYRCYNYVEKNSKTTGKWTIFHCIVWITYICIFLQYFVPTNVRHILLTARRLELRFWYTRPESPPLLLIVLNRNIWNCMNTTKHYIMLWIWNNVWLFCADNFRLGFIVRVVVNYNSHHHPIPTVSLGKRDTAVRFAGTTKRRESWLTIYYEFKHRSHSRVTVAQAASDKYWSDP